MSFISNLGWKFDHKPKILKTLASMERIYEAKIEESEKAGSHLCSAYRGLWGLVVVRMS